MKKKNLKKKKAISLMVSYVLLISIVLTLSIGVYAWLKSVSTLNPPVNCKEGTSITLEDYICDPILGEFRIVVRNNGRFNVNGVIVSVTNESGNVPNIYLLPQTVSEETIRGHVLFEDSLNPNEVEEVIFSNRDGSTGQVVDFAEITKIQIQPFIVKDGEKVICQGGMSSQEISDCFIR